MSKLLTYGIMQQKRSNLLLDTYGSNIALAFSFRKLSSSYSGYCIKVERSSDNATQDIGFSSGIIDTAALYSFIGANDGIIHTWYDQSGNGHNAGPYVSDDVRPKIVTSGTLVTLNSKAGALCTTNTRLVTSSLAGSTILGSSYENMIFSVNNETTSSTNGIFRQQTSTIVFGFHASYAGTIYYQSGNQSTRSISASVPTGWLNNQHSVIGYSNGSNAYIRCDGNQLTTNGVSGTPDLSNSSAINVASWASNPSGGHIGIVQEIIVYKSFDSAYVSGIESNQNTFYSIY